MDSVISLWLCLHKVFTGKPREKCFCNLDGRGCWEGLGCDTGPVQKKKKSFSLSKPDWGLC